MNTLSNKKPVHIHFSGLKQTEQMVFDRVINFNKTHNFKVTICEHSTHANLVITTESTLPQLELEKHNPVTLVITKDSNLGDLQVSSPLLITRVMKALQSAINLVDERPEITVSNSKVENEAKAPVDAPTTTANAPTPSKKEIVQTGLHALVIDDSAAIRKHMELELRDAGIDASFAESGEQAIEKIKERQFDLIFLDIMMPGIDGYETCKLIRTDIQYKKTPIIMLSGKTSPLDEVQGIIAGASTYLTKPVKSEKLQEVLARVTKWIKNYNTKEVKDKTTAV